uniref:Uncharacterized protein n=1 Tax=Timema shepardi TaxID=629360 RepID=A0A7R9AXT6_TIMSH|nr:unnamed protein product [Timema shepardi]
MESRLMPKVILYSSFKAESLMDMMDLINQNSPESNIPLASTVATVFDFIAIEDMLIGQVIIWISEVCPPVARPGLHSERRMEVGQGPGEREARWAAPRALTPPSDSSGWPGGPRATPAVPGFPFCCSERAQPSCGAGNHQAPSRLDSCAAMQPASSSLLTQSNPGVSPRRRIEVRNSPARYYTLKIEKGHLGTGTGFDSRVQTNKSDGLITVACILKESERIFLGGTMGNRAVVVTEVGGGWQLCVHIHTVLASRRLPVRHVQKFCSVYGCHLVRQYLNYKGAVWYSSSQSELEIPVTYTFHVPGSITKAIRNQWRHQKCIVEEKNNVFPDDWCHFDGWTRQELIVTLNDVATLPFYMVMGFPVSQPPYMLWAAIHHPKSLLKLVVWYSPPTCGDVGTHHGPEE